MDKDHLPKGLENMVSKTMISSVFPMFIKAALKLP